MKTQNCDCNSFLLTARYITNGSHEHGQKLTVLMDVVSRLSGGKEIFWFCPQAVQDQACLVMLVLA